MHLMRNVNHKHISADDFKDFFKKWLEIEDVEIIETILSNSDFNNDRTIDINEFV